MPRAAEVGPPPAQTAQWTMHRTAKDPNLYYYFNATTGQASWECAPAQWSERNIRVEGQQRQYYENTTTGQKLDEKPPDYHEALGLMHAAELVPLAPLL